MGKNSFWGPIFYVLSQFKQDLIETYLRFTVQQFQRDIIQTYEQLVGNWEGEGVKN